MTIEDDAHAVYTALERDHSLGVADLATSCGLDEDAVRAALDLLAELHLTGRSTAARPACSPRLALHLVVQDAERRLLGEQARVAGMRLLAERLVADHDEGLHRDSIVRHRGEAVRSRLDELALEVRSDLWVLVPGRTLTSTLIDSDRSVPEDALRRGVDLRIVLQDAVRHDQLTRDYASSMSELGAGLRTTPLMLMPLVLSDRRIALLPASVDDPDAGALELRSPSLVAALSDWFEQIWAASAPLLPYCRRPHGSAAPPVRAVLRLLADGATDEMVARRLGLSARTVRRMVAETMIELGARSRFQAGLLAERSGWLEG